jgi:hypothetical protein
MPTKLVRLRRPGPPPGCREMPAPKDRIDALTLYHHWQDEREKRTAQHTNLDEALAGVIPPGGKAAVTPSTLLYGGRLGLITTQWDHRWWTARLIELSHFGIANLLARLGLGISCRRERVRPEEALAHAIGRRVHGVIQAKYRKAYAGNRISLDNRVYTLAASERLSLLAERQPRSDFGALNFALAGTRADVIDLTRREMWEIKPAALAASAVLQLWAYLDNYEVARVFTGLVEDGSSLQPLEPGVPKTLPPSVTVHDRCGDAAERTRRRGPGARGRAKSAKPALARSRSRRA